MWEVLEYSWETWKKSWFHSNQKISPHKLPEWVISLQEEKFWRNMHLEMIQEEKDSVARKIIIALKETKKHKTTAKIINFPQERSA